MKPLFSALSFLTIIPIPIKWVGDEKTMAKSIWYFPLVSCIIGAITAGVAWLCCRYVASDFISAVLIAATPPIISGGLHLDGLSDSADGLLSARTKSRMLEIMKDSNIGAMGVLVLIFTILLKVGLLTHLTGQSNVAIPCIFLMPLSGRCMFAVMMMTIPYARKGGLGGYFWQRNPLLVIVSLGILGGLSFWLLDLPGIIATACVVAFAVLFSLHCKRKIGGGTGDTLGALCELAEVIFIAAVLFSTSIKH